MNSNILEWAGFPDVFWDPVLKNTIVFGSQYKVTPTEGYLAWEYNPLRNYRLQEVMYEKDGKYYTQKEVVDRLTSISGKTVALKDDKQNPLTEEAFSQAYGDLTLAEFKLYTLREPGELVDFITNELSFDLSHPVDILPLYSYDGSVNLILNDGLNIPRLINSRFTVTGENRYKVIDRKGDNDTNIYDLGTLFDVDTSLFKNVNKIPKLEYLGTSSGNMKIGNYHFYFKYLDADGNESDWVAESGLVSVFIGNTPQSVDTGIRDENSVKSVKFKLSNIDIGYSYVKVWYTRYSAEVDGNFIVDALSIDKKFLISNSGDCIILITGDENTTAVTLEELNSSFDTIQQAKTQCAAGNRLFLANIHKTRIEYDLLSKLSLCFCPYSHTENYDVDIDETYQISSINDGYYDSKYIYDKTGYWPGELYRLGVVYILKDGSLTPVFNIRGATGLTETSEFNFDKNTIDNVVTFKSLDDILSNIRYSEEDFLLTDGNLENENAKGVISLAPRALLDTEDSDYVYGINIKTSHLVIDELKKYVKGFFFVRLKRMPLTLCLGLVIGLDKESKTPTLPTKDGVIANLDTNNTYVETSNIADINYVSEGFLSRYRYTEKAKSTGMFKKLATMVASVVVVAAAAVLTCGAGAVVLGASLATVMGTTLATTAIAASAVTVTATVGIVGLAAYLKIRQRAQGKALQGRNSPVRKGYTRSELSDSRQLTQDLEERYIIKDPSKNTAGAIIVPDYQVNQPYYNLLFTGDKFTLKLSNILSTYNFATDGYLTSKDRHFYIEKYQSILDLKLSLVKLVGVPDGCPVKMIDTDVFKARAGYPEEAHLYEFIGDKYDDTKNKIANSDIIRGNFGSYVGVSNYNGHAGDLVDIMIPGYNQNRLINYIQLRALDSSAFYAISDRIDINEINKNTNILLQAETTKEDFQLTCFRGDCYICLYTHRILRNFNDPSAPYNDTIVDEESWKKNYNPDTPEKLTNINLGDVNAILLGLWLTFRLRSSYNLNVRTIDKSNVDESIMCGNYRSFYPNYGQVADGNHKIPDSNQYNKGFSKSVSEKYYFEVPDVPYIKLEFLNRIIFSDIHINDAYKNGYRVFRNMNHKDYPMTYGSITKLIELKNSLLIIFEHGIGLVEINNQAQYASLILGDLNLISDTYGSLWKDSIIKTPSGIYGVDTVAKKIWRVKEGLLEIISDMKVLEFLNQNITLSERELTPVLGIRNVKTVYNAHKHDIMFTFYDNLRGLSEKSWNLCWNEILGIFTTFYSWIPSNMENIDNIPFSFDRDSVKAISKLGISNSTSDFADGITLTNNVLKLTKNGFEVLNNDFKLTYLNKFGQQEEYKWIESSDDYSFEDGVKLLKDITLEQGFIGFLNLSNRTLFEGKVNYSIKYNLLRDTQDNYKLFDICHAKVAAIQDQSFTSRAALKQYVAVDVYYLILKSDVSNLLSEIYYRNKQGNLYADIETNKIEPIIRPYKPVENSYILNGTILKRLSKQYGIDYPVGFSNYPCGTIKDVYNDVKFAEIPLDEDVSTWEDTQAVFLNLPVKNLRLLEFQGKQIHTDKPVFKNKAGKRLTLPEDLQINPDKIVRYLNIKATVFITNKETNPSLAEAYYGQFVNGENPDLCMIDAGYFESSVAVTTDFNLSLLSVDFWKHGLAGIIDISDKIYPTLWYGKQHPFEFEFVVVDDPSTHKIFTSLELISNKVKPESFHYEVVGDTYDFAEDKPTMYFRLEALKALYLYNGYNIEYDPNFLSIEPKQHNKSADLPKYYSRWDTINNIYDTYKRFSAPIGFNYDHLAGAEIVYYPTRNEFRVWNHVEAIDVDSLNQDIATSVIKANCLYLEDKWLVSINPIIVTYKNEIDKKLVQPGTSMFSKDAFGVYKYSNWVKAHRSETLLPPINILGTKLLEKLFGDIEMPGMPITHNEDGTYNLSQNGKDNALYGLYDLKLWDKGDWRPIDPTKNKERRETDVRGKFMKVRVRYSGNELAIIDFLNTIYQISFA